MTEIHFPSSVKILGHSAFYGCKKLSLARFDEDSQLEKIMAECFRLSGLEFFDAPKKLREIEFGAFELCRKLRDVQLNEGLTIIGTFAFATTGL